MSRRGLRYLGLGLGTGALAGLVAGLLLLAGTLQRPEAWTLDRRLATRGQQPMQTSILVVDVDDSTLDTLGWPVDRALYAGLLAAASRHGARLVAFDVLFTDPSCDTERDSLLAAAASQDMPVLFPLELRFGVEEQAAAPELDSGSGLRMSGDLQALPVATGVAEVLPELREVAPPLAHVQLDNAVDGVFRRVPLVVQLGSTWVPALGLQAALLASGQTDPAGAVQGGELVFPETRIAPIPLDHQGLAWIGYRGDARTLHSITLLEIIEKVQKELDGGAASAELDLLLKNRIVLVGHSAKSVGDHGPTPLYENTPLVLVHANFIDAVLTGTMLRPTSPGVGLGICVLMGLLVGLGIAHWRRVAGALYSLALVGAYFGLAQASFSSSQLVLPVAAPALAAALGFGLVTLLNHYLRDADERVIRQAFARYVAPDILDEIVHRPELLAVRGQKKTLSILFSDIKGYTALSNRKSTDEIMDLLNDYLDAMVEEIFRHHGTVDKIMGDGIMAFFGDPLKDSDHALHAVQCAQAMHTRLEGLRKNWQVGDVDIQIRVGIATDEVFVGNIGSRQHLEYTAIGAGVNLASRLEANGEPGRTIICATTHEAVAEKIDCRPVSMELKGFAEAVRAYEVKRDGDESTPDQTERRSGTRFKLPLDVRIQFEDQLIEATAMDLSAGGMFIAFEEPLPVGAPLVIFAKLPQGKTQLPFRLDATVVRVVEGGGEGDGASGNGVVFEQVTGETPEALTHVLGVMLAGIEVDEGSYEKTLDALGRTVYRVGGSAELERAVNLSTNSL